MLSVGHLSIQGRCLQFIHFGCPLLYAATKTRQVQPSWAGQHFASLACTIRLTKSPHSAAIRYFKRVIKQGPCDPKQHGFVALQEQEDGANIADNCTGHQGALSEVQQKMPN